MMLRGLLILVSVFMLSTALAGKASAGLNAEKSLQTAITDYNPISTFRTGDNDDSDGVSSHQFQFCNDLLNLKQHQGFTNRTKTSPVYAFPIRGPPQPHL